ncbi:12996_t:CDS:10 [Rhizophagus irregularis]|nr:12996_t:CDS:10 [Rhizophagus irregularis]
MVECNISFNYLKEYNLCEEFLSLLSQQHTGVSLDILEEMILMSNIEIENMDLSNNDIIYCTLRDGITIDDRHYEFLTFSASQLRDHSCWFFHQLAIQLLIKVRDWMVNFSTNKSVHSKMCLNGPVFSSTRAIQKLPIDDIIEIPDIVRNGFTFQFVLEVIRGSTFISPYLNRQAIKLLSALGIPDEDKMLESEHTALDFLQRNVDEYGISISLAGLEETFKKKAKIRVDKEAFLLSVLDVAKILRENQIYWAFLLGVLDVTEILQENQIYCYLDGDDFTYQNIFRKLYLFRQLWYDQERSLAKADFFEISKTGTPPEIPPVLRAKNFDQRLYVDGYEESLDDVRKLRR